MRRPRASAQRLDLHALRAGIAGPGLDTRSWVEMGRVDDDPDAVVWDDQLGWLADVTIESGGLAGEGPINCSVTGASDQGRGVYQPLHPGDRVVVALISGDPNVDAVIIGRVHDVDDFMTATTVNGDRIVETNATAGEVAADETYIAALREKDVDVEAANVRLGADAVKVVSPSVCLGTADASEHAVLGDAFMSDLSDFLTAMNTFCASLAASMLPGVANAGTTLQGQVVAFQAQLQADLATRVKVS